MPLGVTMYSPKRGGGVEQGEKNESMGMIAPRVLIEVFRGGTSGVVLGLWVKGEKT